MERNYSRCMLFLFFASMNPGIGDGNHLGNENRDRSSWRPQYSDGFDDTFDLWVMVNVFRLGLRYPLPSTPNGRPF